VAGLCVLMNGSAMPADTSFIDDCRYLSDSAAQAAWQPMGGSAPALAAKLDGVPVLRLSCNFQGTKFERASWDRKVKLDLSSYQGIELRVFSTNVAPVAHFNIYFQSGSGWYSGSFFPDSPSQWNTLEIEKAGLRIEGHPAGWNNISTIRISAWRGRDENTEFYLGGLRGYGVLGQDASVAILRADSVSGEESRSVTEFTANVAGQLGALGIRSATLSDVDVTAAQLRLAKLVVLPHNPSLPDHAAEALLDYLNHGGRVLAFYRLPPQLNAAVKIAGGEFIRGQFSAIQFKPDALEGTPLTVGQHSWNLVAAKPVPGSSRVLAEWLDNKGMTTGYPAVIASQNCILMTHVLLKDDAANKRLMLMAMVGQLAPEVLKTSVETEIARIGRVGKAKNFDDAVELISRGAKNGKRVRAGIESARRMREDARNLTAQGKYIEGSQKAEAANAQLVESYARAQRPLKREFRAFWCHNASGVQGMDWDAAIKRLAENGFNAVVPNMLWGGAAFYPSKVLPVAPEVAEKGDQIAQCLAACRKYGVRMHVWKVSWNLGAHAPAAFVEQMRREQRLQKNSRGEEEPWLCPSHPANQKLEIDSMVEVARNYNVDGIHFDYIRYPDGDHCFCDGCRERFSKAAGVKIRQWPRDVMADGPYRQQWLDWRRNNITSVVQAVSEQARRVRPKIKISAAVFRNWPVDRDGVGQDWKLWCERGYLDFVCPMDYTENDAQFDVWVASQKLWAGKTPVYPGIGASSSSSLLGSDRVIGQIRIARKYKTGGFIVFNYGTTEATELLPMLGLGITRR
jgi:uncharacterized lipoprotein YddW (UPF0748 family)